MVPRIILAICAAALMSAGAGAQDLDGSPFCIAAAREDMRTGKLDPHAAQAFVHLCTMSVGKNDAFRKKLEARASVVPPVLMKACREDRTDEAALICLDILLQKANGSELKALRYFELVRGSTTARRFWTHAECWEAVTPGSVCVSQ